ncbi:MAG: DUF5011 domain-containing protein [Bacteroidetes bacterium]|nr:DUF5011 domain-containing protein [Bacteroidota bacterium]
MKIKQLLPVFFFTCLALLNSCEEDDALGPMEFKFTGLKDTLNYQGVTLERTVSVYFLGGSKEKVTLSATGMPQGTSISFSPATLDGEGSSTQKITSTAIADTGNYVITVTGTTESGKSLIKTFNLYVSRLPNNAPRVFLTGGNNIIHELNAPFVEPGWIAGDEEDGDLTAQVTSSGTVNVDSVGLYFLSYVVTDSEGLKDSVVRTVNVRNSLNFLSGQYNATTTDLQTLAMRNWITTVSASVNTNNQITIFKISDCFYANAILTYDPAKDSIYLPSQTFTCVTAIDSLPHTFQGAGVIIPGAIDRIRIEYTNTWIDTSLGTPVTLQLKDEYEMF